MLKCFSNVKENAIPITVVQMDQYPQWLEKQDAVTKQWLQSTKFKNEPGSAKAIPNHEGKVIRVVCCTNELKNFWSVAGLPIMLAEGSYFFDVPSEYQEMYAIAWGLGAYQFARYKQPKLIPATLYLPKEIASHVSNIVESLYLVRDWTNTPTEDMGPTELADAAKELAEQYQASFSQIIGDDLLKQNYPTIHAVGRACDDAPRLLDLTWGNPDHPKVTLVGKGVCFDTGGLDIKSSAYMLLMKKDMAGAAHAFGLARMIMQANLPVRLRVLVPAVENSVSGNAYRPGDVIKTRKGLTVEIGNTDAEGRLVLADALAEAVREEPAVLIDISTLTGAARIALGTDLPAAFSNNDALINDIIQSGEQVLDPVWRLPLFAGYREQINSPIADLNNCGTESYGGAITAALFLKEFVPDHIPWVHFDLMAWNLRAKPGRPQGGEAMALRSLFYYLMGRFGRG